MDIISRAFERHKEVISKLDSIIPEVRRGADALTAAVKSGKKLLVCGNGGSAADAQHLAAEFVCKYKDDRPPLPAIALTVDTSALTAIGNDYGFEKIFSRQVQALGASGDVLVAVTTSGSSKNILAAIMAAKEKKMQVIALTGANGAHLRDLADVAIIVPSPETARIQEIHGLVIHAWCEALDAALKPFLS